jgi:hypothetical protein
LAPIITANWEAESKGNKWTVPVGGGFGKVFRIGKLRFNGNVGTFTNVVRPDGGADWTLRIQSALLLQTPCSPSENDASNWNILVENRYTSVRGKEMKVLLWLGLFALMLSACGPSQQWVKPGATEADLQTAITLCNRENVHFGRDNIRTIGPDGEVTVTSRQKRYERGAGEMMREQCLESRGWSLEYVD